VDSSHIATGMILSQEVLDSTRKLKKIPSHYGSLPMPECAIRYSQPKLELFGLYRALRHWRIHIIGVKKLIVEVDAKFIKGMLNEPDFQPDTAINRWIQGILMFDFELRHVPAERFQGPDTLSRRPLAKGETVEDDDDSWLDNIALSIFIPDRQFPPFPSFSPQVNCETCWKNHNCISIQKCYSARESQNQTLHDIQHFLTTLQSPVIENIQTKHRFLSKDMEFFVKDSRLYKRNHCWGEPILVHRKILCSEVKFNK